MAKQKKTSSPKQKVAKASSTPRPESGGRFVELGQPGLNQYGGKITDEILKELTGTRGSKIYRQMADNDPTIGALLFAVEQMIRALDWRVEPNSKENAAVDNAEFVKECMHDMSDTWADTISSIMSFLIYGFSVHEIVYKRRNGTSPSLESNKSQFEDQKIGWKRLPIRSQESIQRGKWIYDAKQVDILGIDQIAPPSFKRAIIPIEKLLHFRTQSYKNNPEGKSILRNAYRPWYFKRNIENSEGIGIERELTGLPVMKAPAEIMGNDATPAQKQMYASLKDIVTNIRVDEQAGIILPSTRDDSGHLIYELDLLSSNGSKMFDTNRIIDRYRNEILSTVIADFITLGQGVAGTQALAETKVNLFLNAIQSWVGQIESIFNRFAIPRLLGVNGIKDEIPKLKAEKIKKSDIDQLAKNLLILSQAGMDVFPSEAMDDHVRAELNLPDKTEEDAAWHEEAHENELDAMKPTPPGAKPSTNDTTGQTGAQNPDAK